LTFSEKLIAENQRMAWATVIRRMRVMEWGGADRYHRSGPESEIDGEPNRRLQIPGLEVSAVRQPMSKASV